MQDWSVRLVTTSAAKPNDHQIEQLYSALAELHPACGHNQHGNLELTLTISAPTLTEAINEGIKATTKAVANSGLGSIEITEVEAMTWDEFDRRLDLPQVPELWSVHEAANHLGVSNQRINQLAAAYPEALPAVVKLEGSRGPRIWLADTWRRFAKTERHTARRKSASGVSERVKVSA